MPEVMLAQVFIDDGVFSDGERGVNFLGGGVGREGLFIGWEYFGAWVDLIRDVSWGQPRKFTVCGPPQLQHDEGWLEVLSHSEAK